MLELKGKTVADEIYLDIANQLKLWPVKKWKAPHLAVILVGDDPASQVYVAHKQKACEKLGYKSSLIKLSESISEEDLVKKINEANLDSSIDAILLQLPLPSHLEARKITDLISAAKDSDALTTASLGKLFTGKQEVASCTPSGIIEILKFYKIDISEKNVLVIGRSQIVGLPLFHLLNQMNATVTLAHSKTKELKSLIKQFDYVFVAVGKAHFLKSTDFKKGAIVVDVGIHRLETGLTGDVDPQNVSQHLAAFTPVPGGVGPMTIAMLMQNTLSLAIKNRV